MRTLIALFVLLSLTAKATPQSCTGLCLQQTSCPAGQTTSISGTVYAPNGTDPLPNVLVYIPNAPVAAFTPGVSCPAIGQPPSGSPLVGTTTAVDGTFTLTNVPVGSNIPLVIQTGRWRRQVVVPGTSACTSTSFSTRMPRNQTEGDIPKIAIATGSADQVECVLRKVGIDDTEFTDPSGTGRINLFSGSGSPGARIDLSSLSENVLMGDTATLNSYDVLMLPCEGGAYTRNASQLSNLIQFANAGGRVYSSHFSYVWMYQNPPFNTVANWAPNQASLPNGVATVDTTFSDGQTLAQWLQLVGASTTQGQIEISTLKHDLNGVIPPTQSYLTLNDPTANNPVMQFVFNTPISTTQNQCGRVLFNEYHVENPPTSPANKIFPSECTSGTITPQEKLLEFSLFELTSDGGQPTLTPTSQDFGSQPLGFNSPAQTFTWTNNSTFAASVTTLTASGDFLVTSNNCNSVAAGSSCQINVSFNPSVLGARTGTLTVVSGVSTLTAALTGTGIPDLALSSSSLDFGSIDVGASVTRTITLTNTAPGSVAAAPFAISGDYAVTSSCGSTLGPNSTCIINVIFTPTTTGTRSGTLTVNFSGSPVNLTGNGVDFSIVLNPTSGTNIAGLTTASALTVTPLAGFAAPVAVTCTTTAPAATCALSLITFIPSSPVTTNITLTTTSKYTVVGYGGFGGRGLLWIVALVSACLVGTTRRRTKTPLRFGLLIALLACATFAITGCSGKLPAENASYTPAGNYTFTLTVTDGTITHTTNFSLNVNTK